MLPSSAIRNLRLPASEVVIMSLLQSNALLSERIGNKQDDPFISSFLPICCGNLIKAMGEIFTKGKKKKKEDT